MTLIEEEAARIAALWRSQGEAFLADHHYDVADDIDRLRDAVVVVETNEWREHVGATRDRLRRWDDAFAERLQSLREAAEAARRPGAVIDLTSEEPVVVVPPSPICGRCERAVDADRLVWPFGDRKAAMCIPCARDFAGVRPRRHRPH